jgi:hypothetical protein
MELQQISKVIWAPCAQLYSLDETRQSPRPSAAGLYTRALLVSQDKRHLFVTPGRGQRESQWRTRICRICCSHFKGCLHAWFIYGQWTPYYCRLPCTEQIASVKLKPQTTPSPLPSLLQLMLAPSQAKKNNFKDNAPLYDR